MTISLIKTNSNQRPPTWNADDESSTWLVKGGDDFIGEIIHRDHHQWTAEAMDGTQFSATSRREIIMLLRIHRHVAT